MFRGMDLGEDREEVAVERRGIGDAGVAEQQREDGSQRDPEDHPGDEMCGASAVEFFDEEAGDERSVLCLAPGNNPEETGLHGQIKDGDTEDGEENAARDIFLGLANLATEMTDIVVAPIAVNGVDHGGAEAGKP